MNSFRHCLPTNGNSARNSFQVRGRSYSLTNNQQQTPSMISHRRGSSQIPSFRDNSVRWPTYILDERRSYRSNSIRKEPSYPLQDQNRFSFGNHVYNGSQKKIQTQNSYNTSKTQISTKIPQKENKLEKRDNYHDFNTKQRDKNIYFHNQGTIQNIKTLENRMPTNKTTKENFPIFVRGI